MLESDYYKYVGKEYKPPFGCFSLVKDILEDTRRKSFRETQSLGDFQQFLVKNTHEVEQEKEGDLVLFFYKTWHIGYIISKGRMLHAYAKNSTSCIEEYDNILWRDFIEGFYRINND